MCCGSIEEQTIARVYATHNDGMNKGLNGLACKILSNTSYSVQMERGFFTHFMYMSDHVHVFIEPGPEIFYRCHLDYTSVTYTKASNVHFSRLLPSAYYDEFRLVIVQTVCL